MILAEQMPTGFFWFLVVFWVIFGVFVSFLLAEVFDMTPFVGFVVFGVFLVLFFWAQFG